jgi:signal transduction histidine kinase
MLKIVGEIFASTLTRKQAEEALQQRTRDLETFSQVGQALSAMLDMEQVIEMLLQRVVDLTDSMGSSVWLWEDDEKNCLVCKTAVHNGIADYLIDIRLEPGEGIAGWVAQHGESVMVGAAQTDDRFAPQVDAQTGFQTGSLLAVPLKTRGETIGVLELVETLGASAAIAIENARLFESLQQRNAELDAFAPNVAHDLKNPLSVVIGHADMLLEYIDEMTLAELSQHVKAIGHNVRRMINITDELLLLSLVRRPEEVQIHPLDTAAIVENVQARLSSMIAEYDAEVIIPHSWPAANGYEPWIEQVWINYFSNALKYGGSPPRVELGAAVENGFVRFWVRDNGKGLTPEEQSRLFKPFIRLDEVRVKGYGLGLSIVRRIVRRLGGDVGVESEPGKGSTFSFTVPHASTVEDEA